VLNDRRRGALRVAIPALTSLSETEKLLASFPDISGKQP